MICKYCGNEIPDNSKICFVCNKRIYEITTKDLTQNHREEISKEESTKKYQKARNRIIGSILSLPLLVLVLWYGFININPWVSIIFVIISIVIIPTDIKLQYSIMKEEKQRWIK